MEKAWDASFLLAHFDKKHLLSFPLLPTGGL